MQLSSGITSYLEFQEARGDTTSHRKDCARVLDLLRSHLHDPDMPEITSEALLGFMVAARRRPGKKGRRQVSDHTIAAYHRTLGAFFRYAEGQCWTLINPMHGVPKPRVAEYLIQPFSEDQVQKLLSQPDAATFTGLRDVTLMCFLLDTGCRIAEALSLSYDDVDLEVRTARVMGKGRKERSVPFGVTTRAWLVRYLERRRESAATNYVFVNEYGEKLTTSAMSHRVSKYGRDAGLRGVRATPHTFRHTFAVNWLLGNDDYKGDAISLQRILGHSTPAMTQRYVHFAGQDLRKLHDRLSPADQMASPPPQRRKRLR